MSVTAGPLVGSEFILTSGNATDTSGVWVCSAQNLKICTSPMTGKFMMFPADATDLFPGAATAGFDNASTNPTTWTNVQADWSNYGFVEISYVS